MHVLHELGRPDANMMPGNDGTNFKTPPRYANHVVRTAMYRNVLVLETEKGNDQQVRMTSPLPTNADG